MARLAQFLIASEIRAALIAAVLLVMPLVSWLGASIVALFTLRRGLSGLRWVIGLPLVVALATAFVGQDPTMLIVLVVTVGLAVVLHSTLSWTSTLQALALTGLVLVLLVDAVYAETLRALVVVIKQVLATPDQLAAFGVGSETVDAWLQALSVGALSFVYLVSALLALVFARAMQARAFNPGGFKSELETLQLPVSWSVGCLLVALAGFLVDPWLLRFSPPAALPLMFVGIGLVHGLTAVRESKSILIMFYAALLFFTPYLLLLLALLAVIDAFVDFRTRARQEPPIDEDE